MKRVSQGVCIFLCSSLVAWRCSPRVEIADGSAGEAGEPAASAGTGSGGERPTSSGGNGYGGTRPAASAGRAGAGGASGGETSQGSAGEPAGGTGPEPSVCTPGADQTCNDDPRASAIWGQCREDGTCSCNPGYVNTNTGKCAPRPNGASACAQPIELGPCLDIGVPRFYFDVVTGACREMEVNCGGTPRSGVVFATERECEEACIYPACEVPFADGACDGLLPRFTYDLATDSCQPVTYGGCGGTPNNFRSSSDCQAACVKADGIPASAVIAGLSCRGFGELVTGPGDEALFERDGNVLRRAMQWGCGCATRPEFILMYTNGRQSPGPVALRLCHDDLADSCEANCSREVEWDLSAAFEWAGAEEFEFVE